MAPKLPRACEVAALNDDKLDQYLETTRLLNGDRMVEVEDPENLPESFIQRLRDRASGPSKPVDLDEVSARLLQPAPMRHRSVSIPRSDATSSCSTAPSEDIFLEHLEKEEKAHAKLVQGGGRPFYPIELLPTLSRHPEEHIEIVRYFDYPSKHCWRVFYKQERCWWFFRQWQQSQRESWKDNMAGYTAWIRRGLARRSIAPPPFEMQFNWAQQDKLTEWIEYACYECWELRTKKSWWPPTERESRVLLLGWIADQIPLIQAEMENEATTGSAVASTAVATSTAATTASSATVKRRREEDDSNGKNNERGTTSAKRRKVPGKVAAAAKRQTTEEPPDATASASVTQLAPEPEVHLPMPLQDKTAEVPRGRARMTRTRCGAKSETPGPIAAAKATPAHSLRRSKRIAERETASKSVHSLEQEQGGRNTKTAPARGGRRKPAAKITKGKQSARTRRKPAAC